MIKLSPLEKYQQDLTRDDFQYDAAQENAVKHLQRLYDDLQAKPLPVTGFKKVLNRWKRVVAKQEPKLVKGLYFLGRCWPRKNLFSGYLLRLFAFSK